MIDFDLPSVMDIGGPELVIDQSGIFISNVLSGIINEHVLIILSQVDTCDLRHFVSVLRSLSYQLITVGNSHSLNYSQWTSLRESVRKKGVVGASPIRKLFWLKVLCCTHFCTNWNGMATVKKSDFARVKLMCKSYVVRYTVVVNAT